jgi:hypothetical protein
VFNISDASIGANPLTWKKRFESDRPRQRREGIRDWPSHTLKTSTLVRTRIDGGPNFSPRHYGLTFGAEAFKQWLYSGAPIGTRRCQDLIGRHEASW